jgi:pyruvate,water dikinase
LEAIVANFTAPLDTTDDGLETVGGKGRSLARLTQNGFRVPGGFHVTAAAYRGFVADNDLQARILEAAKPELKDGALSFEKASADIQALFDGADMSPAVVDEITQAYAALEGDDPAIAVRSSANAEDLPDLSFAGQQETYLNVVGVDAAVDAVKRCWGSLWTPQAISYRHQNGIDQASVAMAVVAQIMVPSEVSGILFTANPATGERSEMVLNASFGLGEAVVSGQVTPDTYIIDRDTCTAKETMIGPKEQRIVSDGSAGTRLEDVEEDARDLSSLSDAQIKELAETALKVEATYEGLPQDIEWAYSDGKLHLLQSRPITNLPPQPIEVSWDVPAPATYVSRRQIVENMPDPLCPLFEELYLTEGLESPRKGQSLMIGGGPMYITVNGYGYQRFDFPMVHKQAEEKGLKPLSETELDIAEQAAEKSAAQKAKKGKVSTTEEAEKARQASQEDEEVRLRDVERFREDLSDEDRAAFDAWRSEQDAEGFGRRLTMPESKNPTYVAFNNSEWNDRQLSTWFDDSEPRLRGIGEKWGKVVPSQASDSELLEGIREMGIEEGHYWSGGSSHTFGVAKSTDDQLQCFLRETLPDHNFISGQFLSGIKSKALQANADLFEISKKIRANQAMSFVVLATPSQFLMDELESRNDTREVLDDINQYLKTYGHQGYSMDFIEPTQIEDPSALFATLKAMVADPDYDPKQQDERARKVREEKYAEIIELLNGLEYWQFRFRLWLARKYNYIREEVAFLFGYTWSILRPMAVELGQRMVDAGTFQQPDDTYFLVTEELERAIEARSAGKALPDLGELAAERRELREARKRHHPPGTLPAEASQVDGIAFKETQIKNEEGSDLMRGFPVSSGKVTAKASVITGAAEFDKMAPGSILVSPLTTPAWTQLFAHAVGLVTDVGSILAHGSIVAREYGIPAVLGVGNGTQRIKHGQTITIDGDAGTVIIHEDDEDAA